MGCRVNFIIPKSQKSCVRPPMRPTNSTLMNTRGGGGLFPRRRLVQVKITHVVWCTPPGPQITTWSPSAVIWSLWHSFSSLPRIWCWCRPAPGRAPWHRGPASNGRWCFWGWSWRCYPLWVPPFRGNQLSKSFRWVTTRSLCECVDMVASRGKIMFKV